MDGKVCVALRTRLIYRRGALETLAREEHGDFWVASRACGGVAQECASQTFLMLTGHQQRNLGVAECDHKLRLLASQHPEFGL